jgi:hypothetical protein
MAAKTRKCAHCSQEIDVKNKEDLGHVLRYKNKYYHTTCFVELAESRVARKGCHSTSWQEALDNIDKLIEDAREAITTKVNKKTDNLNKYLKKYYQMEGSFSQRFWSTIMDIENGIYKRRCCGSIDCNTLLDMWKYYQKELDNTNIYNKTHGKFLEGEVRANYDLAILMGKYGAYIKAKAKEEAAAEEARNRIITTNKIDYEALYKQKSQYSANNDNDIIALMEDIF